MMRCPDMTDLPPPRSDARGWPWTVASPPADSRTAEDGAAWPRISVVTPSFNQAEFLEETIRSVLLQDYPDLEYIVIDGGSTDGSVDIIRRYEPWLAHWVSEPDRGQSHAINKGFERATGELLAWLNSDDIYEPGALRRVAQAWLERESDAIMIVGDGRWVEADGEPYGLKRCRAYAFEDLLAYYDKNYLCQPAVFFSREALRRAGPVAEDLHFTMDLDLWLRMRSQADLAYVPAVLARMRRHESAKTWAFNSEAMLEVARTLKRYDAALPWPRRLVNRLRMRRCRGISALQAGLDAIIDYGQRGPAWRSLMQAVALWPASLFTPWGARLMARLGLPDSLRMRVNRLRRR